MDEKQQRAASARRKRRILARTHCCAPRLPGNQAYILAAYSLARQRCTGTDPLTDVISLPPSPGFWRWKATRTLGATAVTARSTCHGLSLPIPSPHSSHARCERAARTRPRVSKGMWSGACGQWLCGVRVHPSGTWPWIFKPEEEHHR